MQLKLVKGHSADLHSAHAAVCASVTLHIQLTHQMPVSRYSRVKLLTGA